LYRNWKIGVVIPAHNEEKLLGKVFESMPPYVDLILPVNDGSTDGTQGLIDRHAGEDPRIRPVVHANNHGVGASIGDGYRMAYEAGMDAAVVMAGDGQMDPAQLARLLDPVVDGKVDYAKGNRLPRRELRRKMPKARLFGNSILSLLTKISSGYWNILDPQNGYTAANREVLEKLDLEGIYPGYGCPNDMLIKLNVYNFRVGDVWMPAVYGSERSGIRMWKYVPKVSWLLLKGFFWRLWEKYVIIDFHPLIFFYILGMVLLPVGLALGLIIVYNRLLFGAITLSTVVLAALLIISGMQSLFFAMLFDMQSSVREG
jgi:glycosyltransferase involved in cell wall biosynthesis